jgi:hypothetical protein
LKRIGKKIGGMDKIAISWYKRVFGSWTIVDGMDGPDFCGWDWMILVFVWFEGLRDGMRSVLS